MRRLIALVLGPVLLALVAPLAPAAAATWRGTDPAHDVWRLTLSGDGDDYTAAPTRANADLRSVVVRHGRSRVVLRLRFDDIFVPPERGGMFSVFGDIRTDDLGASFDMVAGRAHRQGRVTVWQRGGRFEGSSAIDYRRDVATITVPTDCLGDPRWVRLSFKTWSRDDAYVWEDNALQAGFLRQAWTPKVRVG